jgi:hypothetical protein
MEFGEAMGSARLPWHEVWLEYLERVMKPMVGSFPILLLVSLYIIYVFCRVAPWKLNQQESCFYAQAVTGIWQGVAWGSDEQGEFVSVCSTKGPKISMKIGSFSRQETDGWDITVVSPSFGYMLDPIKLSCLERGCEFGKQPRIAWLHSHS